MVLTNLAVLHLQLHMITIELIINSPKCKKFADKRRFSHWVGQSFDHHFWQDFRLHYSDLRTGPYFITHTLLCFKKTIAITIDILWDCGALFFLLRGFFLSPYGL